MSNYFSILPAELRYHKELSFGEKILYAEITACADENGICTATNEHFSGAFVKSVKWVSNSLTSLKKAGVIDVHIDSHKGNYREIQISGMLFSRDNQQNYLRNQNPENPVNLTESKSNDVC